MWNLISKTGLFIHPKIKNPGLNVLDLDFNEIVNFLNQEDFDIKNVDGFDTMFCNILYNDISPYMIVLGMGGIVNNTTGEVTEPTSLTIIFNSSYDTYDFWLVEYLIALHVEIYSVNPFNHSWYLSKEMKHANEKQINTLRGISFGKVVNNLFPTDEEYNKFIQKFPEDVKNYCYSFSSIYDREVNRKNLKKVVKSGFPKKKKVSNKLTKFITETINAIDHFKYMIDNNLWPETEK